MQFKAFEGKYVDISYANGQGGSGWVKEVKDLDGVTYIVFDYGYAFPMHSDVSVTEVNPPEGDKGMFN